MNETDHATTPDESTAAGPVTLPITVEQYEALVARGDFERISGQVELIFGRIVRTNPQGPQHADPIDWLTEWSIEQAERQFTIRVEKPIIIPDHHSRPLQLPRARRGLGHTPSLRRSASDAG